jgi:oligopeptide transport system substrate-binding protein
MLAAGGSLIKHGEMRIARLFWPLAMAALAAGCGQKSPDAIAVSVIGPQPELADPAAGPLTAGERVLVASVARGLVMFDAGGEIVPGLAERWNVSDDGLSYIFRLESGEWPDGRKITAYDVARQLRRQIAPRSRNPLKDSLGSVTEIVAMTERVIEIRLTAPRPQLLQTLAQPEFAILRDGAGTGPFAIRVPEDGDASFIRLHRDVADRRSETSRDQRVRLRGDAVRDALTRFVRGEVQLVLGGTADDLPYARAIRLPRNTLRFDPAIGHFGLVPARSSGPVADPDVRELLSAALDREALIAQLKVPGLVPRASLLQPGLAAGIEPLNPDWAALPLTERLPRLTERAGQLFAEENEEKEEERPVINVALPDGPGGKLLLARLRTDWGRLGLQVEPAGKGAPADLKLVDEVAPARNAAWLLRRFRCAETPICSDEADRLLDAARVEPGIVQRNALLMEANRLMSEKRLFIPLTAPVRWSLVSRGLPGFAENIFAVHPLWDLERRTR